MKHYCEKRDPWTGKVYPDCRTWDQCHHRGICLAAPKAKADENHAKERHWPAGSAAERGKGGGMTIDPVKQSEDLRRIIKVAHKHGWDGVNNSEILWVFLDEELTEKARLKDHADSLRVAWKYEQAKSPRWREIASAPYGEFILVCGSKNLGMAVARRMAYPGTSDEWTIETCSSVETIYPPKYWMPLPEAAEGAK